MRVKCLLARQWGLSLVEILIALALTSGVALIAAKLIDDQAYQQNHVKTMASISQHLTRIESHINNPAHCKKMFSSAIQGHEGSAKLGKGDVDNEDILKVDSVVVLREGKHDFYDIPNNGVHVDTGFGENVISLKIVFKPNKKTAFSYARGEIIKEIPFIGTRDTDGKVLTCGPVLSEANSAAQKLMCESLGEAAFWDATNSKCVLKEFKCPFGEVAVKMDELGKLECRKIQEQVKIDQLFDMNGIDCSLKTTLNLQVVNSDNKFKVTCPGEDGAGAGSNCSTPWGASLAPGASVTAYQSAAPSCPSSCVSETRTCASDGSGVLSGSYTQASCTAPTCSNCTTPWGASLAPGASVTAYQSAAPSCPSSCVSQTRTCASDGSGVLSGTYANASCTAPTCSSASCTAPWGETIPHGQSRRAYRASSQVFAERCIQSNMTEIRTCNDGVLSGAWINQMCSDPSGAYGPYYNL
jgi:hypothetical protein